VDFSNVPRADRYGSQKRWSLERIEGCQRRSKAETNPPWRGRPSETDHLTAVWLRERELIAKARAFPYQLMVAYANADGRVPDVVKEALQDAMEVALENCHQSRARSMCCRTYRARCIQR